MPITSDAFIQALKTAGVLGADDRIRRIVIDARQGWTVAIHVEMDGDVGLLAVVSSLDGVKIHREYKPPGVYKRSEP